MGAENEGVQALGGQHALLRRLIATLPGEPLLAVYTEDLRALPAKFSRTSLNAMLQDPSYAESAAQAPRHDQPGGRRRHRRAVAGFQQDGPRPGRAGDRSPVSIAAPAAIPDFKLVLLVATQTEETAAQLLASGPSRRRKATPCSQPCACSLWRWQRLAEEREPPPWLAAQAPGRAGTCACAHCRARLRGSWPCGWRRWTNLEMGWDLLAQLLSGVYGEATGYFGLSLTINGELFHEEAEIELLPAALPPPPPAGGEGKGELAGRHVAARGSHVARASRGLGERCWARCLAGMTWCCWPALTSRLWGRICPSRPRRWSGTCEANAGRAAEDRPRRRSTRGALSSCSNTWKAAWASWPSRR